LPAAIIVYRDGVGAGDIPRLKDTEIAALKVRWNDHTLRKF
jgi:aubergine-like protein